MTVRGRTPIVRMRKTGGPFLDFVCDFDPESANIFCLYNKITNLNGKPYYTILLWKYTMIVRFF